VCGACLIFGSGRLEDGGFEGLVLTSTHVQNNTNLFFYPLFLPLFNIRTPNNLLPLLTNLQRLPTLPSHHLQPIAPQRHPYRHRLPPRHALPSNHIHDALRRLLRIAWLVGVGGLDEVAQAGVEVSVLGDGGGVEVEVLVGEDFCAEEARFEDDTFDVERVEFFLDGFDNA